MGKNGDVLYVFVNEKIICIYIFLLYSWSKSAQRMNSCVEINSIPRSGCETVITVLTKKNKLLQSYEQTVEGNC